LLIKEKWVLRQLVRKSQPSVTVRGKGGACGLCGKKARLEKSRKGRFSSGCCFGKKFRQEGQSLQTATRSLALRWNGKKKKRGKGEKRRSRVGYVAVRNNEENLEKESVARE